MSQGEMSAAPIRILVPTDFKKESVQALARALAIAHVHNVTAVRVVHIQTPGHSLAPVGRLGDIRATIEADLSRAPRAVAKAVVTREAPTIVDGILEAASEMQATLILIGTRGGGLMSEGVAEQIVCRAPTDVLVVGQNSDRRWPDHPVRVLVPIDFSDNARRALAAARGWAGTNTVAALHVIDPSDPDAAVADRAPGRLRARVAEWAGDWVTEVAVAEGSPERVIAQEAGCASVGLVVVGATGTRDKLGHIIHGVPQRLIQATRAPVLIVR